MVNFPEEETCFPNQELILNNERNHIIIQYSQVKNHNILQPVIEVKSRRGIGRKLKAIVGFLLLSPLILLVFSLALIWTAIIMTVVLVIVARVWWVMKRSGFLDQIRKTAVEIENVIQQQERR